ncbi:MAG: TetR/AcrR family transcriptional regulator, partial [Bradyrhizobium sp.]
KAIGTLLSRAVAAGAIRDDISAEDVLRALIGMCYMHDQPGWQTTALRLLDVFVDGLRVLPANPVLTTRPAKKTTRRPSR